VDARHAEEIRLWNEQPEHLANAQGKTHIGFGIYFHAESFFRIFSEEDRAVFFAAEKDPLAIARLLVSHLQGDYDDARRKVDYEEGIDARSTSSKAKALGAACADTKRR